MTDPIDDQPTADVTDTKSEEAVEEADVPEDDASTSPEPPTEGDGT